MLCNPLLPSLAVSRRKSDVLPIFLYLLPSDLPTSGHIFTTHPKLFFPKQTLYHCLRVVRPVEGIYFGIIIIIMFDFVCDRLGSPSDLVKSWGGGGCDGRMQGTSAGIGLTGHSIILYMSSGARALLIALCLQVHTHGGKLGYIYNSGRPHGHLSVQRAEERLLYYCVFTKLI